MPEPTMKCLSKLCDHEYVKTSLSCPQCGYPGITRLYRYQRFDKYTLDIFRNQQIWYPQADGLNDPFEFAFHRKASRIDGIKIDQNSWDMAIAQMKTIGVLSFSEVNNHILMWSHYAGSHKGLCIEFARNETCELGDASHTVPVLYDDALPSVQPLELQEKATTTRIFTTKGKLWEYEAEWRILTHKGNRVERLPGQITGVIFGIAMPEVDRERVRSILKNGVRYYEATMGSRYFGLQVEEMRR